jgi:hypothetical protein
VDATGFGDSCLLPGLTDLGPFGAASFVKGFLSGERAALWLCVVEELTIPLDVGLAVVDVELVLPELFITPFSFVSTRVDTQFIVALTAFTDSTFLVSAGLLTDIWAVTEVLLSGANSSMLPLREQLLSNTSSNELEE